MWQEYILLFLQIPVFADEKEPGSAAVYVKLVAGKTLSQEQVKSIVALVSGSTAISKDNIK